MNQSYMFQSVDKSQKDKVGQKSQLQKNIHIACDYSYKTVIFRYICAYIKCMYILK